MNFFEISSREQTFKLGNFLAGLLYSTLSEELQSGEDDEQEKVQLKSIQGDLNLVGRALSQSFS